MSDGLHIASWPLEEPAAIVAKLLGWLSDDERQRADTFTREEARRRFVVGRGRLRQHLGERLNVAPNTIAFRYGPAGKPEVANDPTTHFNLAHSGELALLAIGDRPVGIDLERRRPMKNARGLAERWFHPAEVARIAAAEASLDEFFRTWTMKEAALKLVGVGVGESLPKVRTPDDPAGGLATGLPANALGVACCRVEPIASDAAFSAAIALPPDGDA